MLVWEPTFPGCLIKAKPVGLFRMSDEKGLDDKILCVPIGDPMWNSIKTLKDVPQHLLKEIQHFFAIYKELEDNKTGIEGWRDYKAAVEVIRESQESFRKK